MIDWGANKYIIVCRKGERHLLLCCDNVRASLIGALYHHHAENENDTRPALLRYSAAKIFGDVLITELCCKTLTRLQTGTQGWAPKRGEVSKMLKCGAPASQGCQVFLPFVLETYSLWGKHFQDFFATTMEQAEEYRGIPGAAISMYWRRRISVTLHKTMAEGILARAGRLNSGPFRDESSWEGVIESQRSQPGKVRPLCSVQY